MNKLTAFLSSRTGKRILNMAYSWGACLVILGAIFKISHYPYDDLFLMVGMCTEVLIFFISGLDEPSKEYKWERIFPMLSRTSEEIDEKGNVSFVADTSVCREKMLKMEEKLDQINEVYEKQLRELTLQVDNMGKLNSNFEKMQEICSCTIEQSAVTNDETQQMSEKIAALNLQYAKMLEAMNVSVKKK